MEKRDAAAKQLFHCSRVRSGGVVQHLDVV